MFEIKPRENQNLEVKILELPLTYLTSLKSWVIFMIFVQILVIYTVVYKESESEVKKYKILEPGGKNYEKLT